MTARDLTRFWSQVVVSEGDGCWLWTARLHHGYGRFYYEGRRRQAHGVAYELIVGEIETGMVLHHECEIPSCVNPAHLKPVTQAEHMHVHKSYVKANARSREVKRAATHCIHGHAYDAANTRLNRQGYRYCGACTRERWRRYQNKE